MKCDCEQWEKGIKAVNGPIELQCIRSGFEYQFPKEYVFLFCPWCGQRLPQDCAVCGELSNSKTGKTIYWQGDVNFCSPKCSTESMVPK